MRSGVRTSKNGSSLIGADAAAGEVATDESDAGDDGAATGGGLCLTGVGVAGAGVTGAVLPAEGALRARPVRDHGDHGANRGDLARGHANLREHAG